MPQISFNLVFLFRFFTWIVYIKRSNFICTLESTMSKMSVAVLLSSLHKASCHPNPYYQCQHQKAGKIEIKAMKEEEWAGAAWGLWEEFREYKLVTLIKSPIFVSGDYFCGSLWVWLMYRAINKRWFERCHLEFCNAQFKQLSVASLFLEDVLKSCYMFTAHQLFASSH